MNSVKRWVVRTALMLTGLWAADVHGQTISGRVFVANGGGPVSGAVVSAFVGEGLVAETTTALDGAFALAVTWSEGLSVTASKPGLETSPLQLLSATDLFLLILLEVPDNESGVVLSATGAGGRLLGRVVDESGRPLPGVAVGIGDGTTLTGPRGTFELSIVPGSHMVNFSRLGLSTFSRRVEVSEEAGIFMDVVLTSAAVQLPTISVEVVARSALVRLDDLRHRLTTGGGSYTTADELEVRGYPSMLETLGSVSGVNVSGGIPIIRGNRNPPTFYIDGMKISSWEAARSMTSQDIELVEVYKGPASTPAEFVDSDSLYGVVLIWTRRGLGLPLSDLVGRGGG